MHHNFKRHYNILNLKSETFWSFKKCKTLAQVYNYQNSDPRDQCFVRRCAWHSPELLEVHAKTTVVGHCLWPLLDRLTPHQKKKNWSLQNNISYWNRNLHREVSSSWCSTTLLVGESHLSTAWRLVWTNLYWLSLSCSSIFCHDGSCTSACDRSRSIPMKSSCRPWGTKHSDRPKIVDITIEV